MDVALLKDEKEVRCHGSTFRVLISSLSKGNGVSAEISFRYEDVAVRETLEKRGLIIISNAFNVSREPIHTARLYVLTYLLMELRDDDLSWRCNEEIE